MGCEPQLDSEDLWRPIGLEFPVIKFIREDQVAKEFKALSETDEGVVVAAPFWGTGATKMLGLEKRRNIRILCSFDALACNPAELAELHKAGAEIRSNGRLHAKIYAAGQFVIVGSSNPSRYGLTQDGDTIGGSIEGNVLTDDASTVEAVANLIEDLWSDKKHSVRITPKMVADETARRANLPKRFKRSSLAAKTLLAAYREGPELFDTVYVAHYWDDLGKGGKAELRRLRGQAAASAPSPKFAIFRNAWGYQLDEPPPAGAWLIALDCRKPGNPKVWGASQVPVPSVALAVPNEYDLYPTIRGVVTVPDATGRFRISGAEKAQLVAIAGRLKRRDTLVPLGDAVALIDRLGLA